MTKKKSEKKSNGRLQSDFITLTSHQLRTPLSGVKWLLELLQSDGTNLNKKQKDLLQKIYSSNERMIALVNDLLEVSRIEAGESKLYLQPTDLAPIIRGLLKEKEDQIKKKRIKVALIVEQEPLPLVRTEPNKIRQALGNLVSNAISYTPESGSVSIALSVQDGTILVSIKDTGVGIPKEEQKQVFTKFFRGTNILNFETNGTGLGLYITKAFVEASGGRIWFRSEENKGTTFYFTLPIA
ncbi:MAG: HAMP domain-containing histidine kinase [Candidatus Doudnabacteria bacterium]|nr:HAMP domain-containing histidine kinase [Candidatus Doudnabacteria bacterium]